MEKVQEKCGRGELKEHGKDEGLVWKVGQREKQNREQQEIGRAHEVNNENRIKSLYIR